MPAETLTPYALLTARQSQEADRNTIASGIPGATLMEGAGETVADVICSRYLASPALIICGAGNNGGDGFVIARLLKARGWNVATLLVGDAAQLHDDAAQMLKRWQEAGGTLHPAAPINFSTYTLIVDALFGTGLSRTIEGEARTIIEQINASALPVVAVDLPSGIHADTGAIMGIAIRASLTVTFVRGKPGLYLLPGKAHAGEIIIADIGITPENNGDCFLNVPELWRERFPFPSMESHKYTRGHCYVAGGGLATTGAARMAAMAALRAGAGLVSVLCDSASLPVYAAKLTAVMTKIANDIPAFRQQISEPRISALLIGPGMGISDDTREKTLAILVTGTPCVLDAEALSSFADAPDTLFRALHPQCVLTPHEGEFARLFAPQGDKLTRALAAAKSAKAVVLLKGNDTVIASPDGRAAINANAPAWLATAGSGDVLAGIIAGLLAQGLNAFDAACAGAWLHGEAAGYAGYGMIAEDLPALLPNALNNLSPLP